MNVRDIEYAKPSSLTMFHRSIDSYETASCSGYFTSRSLLEMFWKCEYVERAQLLGVHHALARSSCIVLLRAGKRHFFCAN